MKALKTVASGEAMTTAILPTEKTCTTCTSRLEITLGDLQTRQIPTSDIRGERWMETGLMFTCIVCGATNTFDPDKNTMSLILRAMRLDKQLARQKKG